MKTKLLQKGKSKLSEHIEKLKKFGLTTTSRSAYFDFKAMREIVLSDCGEALVEYCKKNALGIVATKIRTKDGIIFYRVNVF